MAHRILSSNLETSLLNNDPFAYAHLIKFERPTETESGRPAEKATDYSYIGDGSFDITWDDGSSDIDGNLNGPQIYVANRVLNVGTVAETIQAKASNINIELSTIAISTTFTGTINVTSNSITANESLVDVGFAEGDVLKCTTAGSNNGLTIRIDEFSNDNKTAAVTPINRTSISTDSAATYTLDYASDETIGILSQTNKFVNREVFIYKAHIDPATGSIIGDPYLLFKGIIASAKLSEDPSKSSKISWGVTSHWGDFVRVNGRSTSDDEHRALDGAGSSDLAALVRPEYASDLGFLHSEQSLNVMAVYQVKETRYKEKRRGGLAGLMGGKKLVEYEVEVDRELDLRFNLDAKRLPVVYGVQRIDSFPIFIDTLKDNSNVVHVAYALCEGEIAGIYDIYIEDQSSICIDQNDNDTRSNSSTAEVLCTGRMDRGDTLSPRATYDAGIFSYYSGGSYSWGTGASAWASREGLDGVGTSNLFNYQPLDNILGGVDVGTLGGSGITHEKGTSFTTPIPTDLVVHTGKPFQRSSNTLSKIASENNFKVQNDYFESTGDYWGPNHQLLDTAYVTAKFTIGEGETTIPELEFIVRGKMIDCYNYDNSYLQDYTFSDPLTGFAQGDIVTIKNTSGDTILSTATIADIESYKDENGSDIYRVRFQDELTLGSATAFYMTNGVNNYHFTTHDHTYATGTVASTLTGSTTWSDNATLDGVNAEVVVTPAMLTALIEANFIGEVTDEELTAAYGSFLSGTSINTFEINATGNVIEDLGSVAGASSISGDVQVIVKDAIHLATSESSTDDAYVNLEIELVRTFDDQSQHIQKRKITDYTGLQRVAIVDRPWDSGVIPQAGDTYRLISTGDKRVSTNPAMQLLDYITSTRYGRGLDVYKDINIESFKEAARDCDTRSSVTMLVPATANVVVDAVYKYEDANPVLRFQGTVESVTAVTISGTNYKEIEFKDVIGKIATKWSDWRYFLDGELVWYAGGVYTKSGDGYLSTAPTGASVAVTISKVSGSGDATLSLDVDSTRKTFDGNPVVKKWRSSNNTFQSGYSLYDSDDVKYWRYLGWNDSNQRYVTRHQTNAVINTNNSVFQNINSMLAHFNGILRYSNGKYDLVIKKATDTFEAAQYITDEDIIGSINVEDAGQKGTYNSVSVGIPDPQNRYETRTVSFFDSTFLKKDRNVPKKGDIKTPYVTNYFNARINARQYLEESRKSLKIAFKMEPKGLLLTSGSLIKVTNNRFGWVEEEFRITNLNFQGNCLVDVTAEQHSEEAYLIKNLTKAAYTPGEVAGQAEPVLSPPTSLQILNNNEKGGTRLGWTNSSSYKAANHTVEIYRGTVDDVNNANTQLVATAKGSEFTDPVLTAGTYYYWIRYSIVIDGTRSFLTAYEGSVTATIADIVDGQSAKTVNIYRKNDNTINTSTGTFADPLAGNTSWSLSVPALTVNNDIVYVSTRTFTSDGLAPQDAAWSTPAIYSTRVDGADGADGDDGAEGLRTIQGYLYYEKTTAGAPSAPSGDTYTFATGDVSGGTGATEVLALSATSVVDKWTNEPRTQDPTTNTHYTIRYSGTESSAGSSTITVTYSDVVQYTNFTGIVTFENGDFLEGGSTITTIDGGNIDAASQITVGTGVNKAGLSGVGTLGTDIRIFAGDTIANRATAPFRVDQDGVVYATNAEITGEVVASTLVMSTTNQFVNLKAQSVQDDSITLASLNTEVLNYIDSTAATLSGNTPGDYQTGSTTFTNATLANTPLITLSNFDHGLSNPRITVSLGTGFFSPNDYSVAQRTISLTVYRKPSSGSTWTSLFSTGTTLIQQLFPQNPDFTKFYYAGSFSEDFEDTTLVDNTEYDYKIELTAVVIPQEATSYLSFTANENAYTSNGAGDAATLNGLDSTHFLRSDENDVMTGILNIQGSLLVNSLIRFDTDYTVISSSTAQTEIGSFNYLNNAGAKLIITAEYGTERQITELLVTHNNTIAIAVEYGSIDTDGVLATYDVDISGNNVRILATCTSTNTTIFTTSKQIII